MKPKAILLAFSAIAVLLAVTSSCKGCAPKRNVEIVVAPANGGTVQKEPNRDVYRRGDQLTLTAIPAEGYGFTGWSEGLSGVENPIRFTVEEDIRIVATFETLPPTKPGTLTVTLLPVDAIASGAQWRVSGQSIWRGSGDALSDLDIGDYPLEFRPVSGFAAPLPQVATMAAGEPLALSCVYTALAPPAPEGLTASPGPDNVLLSWEEATVYPVAGYHVYCAASGSAKSEMMCLTSEGPVRALRFQAAPGTAGIAFDYWVNAVTQTGQQGPPSPVVSAAWGSVKARLPIMAVEPGEVVRIPVAVENASGLSAETIELVLEFLDDSDRLVDVFGPDSLDVVPTLITMDTAPEAVWEDTGRIRITAGVAGASMLAGEGRLFEIVGRVSAAIALGQTFEMRIDGEGSQLYQGDLRLFLDTDSVGLLVASDECMRGDVNNSKLITRNDAQLALDIAARLVSPDECHWRAGDLTLDARIDSADATVILRVLAGWYDNPATDGTPSLRDILRPTTPVSVSVGEAAVDAGDDILVPVTIQAPGGIHGVDIAVGWPLSGDQLTLTDILPNSELGFEAASINMDTPGMARIALSRSEAGEPSDVLQMITPAWLQYSIGGSATANYAPSLTVLGVKLYGPYGELADWFTQVHWDDGRIIVVPQTPGEGETAPVLSVSPSQQYVGANAGSVNFLVDNIGQGLLTWTAEVISGGAWLSINAGKAVVGPGAVTAFHTANTSPGSRTGEIRVAASGAENSPQVVRVIQSGTSGEGEPSEGEAEGEGEGEAEGEGEGEPAMQIPQVFGSVGSASTGVFSPDGNWILIGGGDSAHAALMDVSSGAFVNRYFGHTGWIRQVAFSPDAALAATASSDSTARLWDTNTGRQRHILDCSSDVLSLAFSPNGSQLATLSYDNTVRVWNVSTGREQRTLAAGRSGNDAVAFSPDGTLLAYPQFSETILTNVSTGMQVRTLPTAGLIAFSPDGNFIQIGARSYDVETGVVHATLPIESEIQSLAYSPSGNSVAAAVGAVISLYDANSGALIRNFEGHEREVHSISFSPDGNSLFSLAYNESYRLWNTSTGELLRTFDMIHGVGNYEIVAFSNSGNLLLSGGGFSNSPRIWNIADGGQLTVLPVHDENLVGAVFSHDESTVLTLSGSSGYTTPYRPPTLWDVATGAQLLTFTDFVGTTGALAFASMSQDGSRVVLSSSSQTVGLWDGETGEKLRDFGWSGFGVISSDGMWVAAGGNTTSSLARVYHAETGIIEYTLENNAEKLAFSSDSRYLAFQYRDNYDRTYVGVFDVSSGETAWTMEVPDLYNINDLKFNAANTHFIICANLYNIGLVRHFDVTNGSATSYQIDNIRLAGQVNHLTVSSDGTQLAAGTIGGPVLVWSLF